jgi:CheY-like chemotaxis protein
VNLGRFVQSMDDMLQRALGEAVQVQVVVADPLWNTSVDLSQVENAVLNLAINARDAMEGVGKLTVELGNAVLDDAYARSHAEVNAGEYVMLAVSDTGAGMTAEVMAQAFDPFYTTKPEGKGTGLGLSMVYGFIKQSGGHVKIYSEIGHGTTVKLYLPRSRDAEQVIAPADTRPLVGGTETILVAEDDEQVRAIVVETLKELGYQVLMASDAEEALAVVKSGIKIDLLFTDVVMPGPLRSPDLARKARELLPDLAVLFTSGYTRNAIVHGGRLDPGVELLAKPYSREDLSRRVRQSLAKRSQEGALPPGSRGSAAEPGSGRLRILLVDGDEVGRATTAQLLSRTGHAVTQARSGEQALAALDVGGIDVLLVNSSLTGMSVTALAEAARQRQPQLAVVLASDQSDPPAVPYVQLLAKPYDVHALSMLLSKLDVAT